MLKAWRTCFLGLLICCIAGLNPASASSLRISSNSTTRLPTEVEADYKTSHLFVNEVAGDKVPLTIFFDPQMTGVQSAEVYTNLNRRDRAALPAGAEEGIRPP